MTILAMKCLRDRPGPVDQLVQGISTRQIAYVKGKQDKDGGFDDLISTSLAVQVHDSTKSTFNHTFCSHFYNLIHSNFGRKSNL